MENRSSFYKRIVKQTITSKTSSVLVCGAGTLDKNVFYDLGFKDVTISNLDSRANPEDFHPFKWSFQNAEYLSVEDNSFDYVVIHAAIHHASLPHKVLTEMYRVSKKGVLAFESRDSLLMRFLERFQLTQTYETAAVYYNDCKYAGVNNTEIPNFVFRWTEREIEKTIQVYAPYFEHRYIYNYGTAFPAGPSLERNGRLKIIFLNSLRGFYWAFSKIFKKQQNLFSFFIEKPQKSDVLFPWLSYNEATDTVVFNREWGDRKYKKSKSD
tara:strand:- start:385 stop:1188 length:804 start_codon:yes stop_codon:yes gene_type:complete